MNTLIAILSAISLAELAGLITTISLLRPNRQKAKEEAQRLHAEARAEEIKNDERMTSILMTNVVEPLRAELKSLRETAARLQEEVDSLSGEVEDLTKEIARLKRAVNKANTCQHKEGCPVLEKLQEEKAQ